MKTIALMTAAAVMALTAGTSFAATAQQGKMATCSKQASAQMLKGADRKAFMSNCLKAAPAAAPAGMAEKPAAMKKAEDMRGNMAKPETMPGKAATAQQSKMGTCSKEAASRGLSGADRKAFMSSCLKGSASKMAPKAAPAATGRMTKSGKPMTANQAKFGDCATKGKGLSKEAFQAHMKACMKQ